MIEIILTEEPGETLTTNDLQWFQEAILSAAGHSGNPYSIAITDGKISTYVVSSD